jgi:hypothetical protein
MPPTRPPIQTRPAPQPVGQTRAAACFIDDNQPPQTPPQREPAPRLPGGKPPPPPHARRPGPQTGQTDATGHPIPDHLIELWDRRTEIEDLLAHVSKARCAIQDAQRDADPLFAELNTSSTLANLNTAYDQIKATAPHAVCPWCHGTLSDQCRGCKGRGMIGNFAWGRVPADLRKGRTA